MTQERMRETIDGYIKAYNDMNVPAMINFLHEDIVFHTITNGTYGLPVNGKAEFQKLATETLQLFSARKQTVTQINYDGDKARAAIDYEGKLALDMQGFGKTGETITFKGHSEFVFKDGLIIILSDFS